MTIRAQRNFSGGEISPDLYARVDTAKYQKSVRKLRGAYTLIYGGMVNEAGTEFVGKVEDSTKKARLIPFKSNDDVTRVLEFSANKIRFIKEGKLVKKDDDSIYSIGHTPYDENMLSRVRYAQANDVLTLTHIDSLVKDLKFKGLGDWSLESIPFESPSKAPNHVAIFTKQHYAHTKNFSYDGYTSYIANAQTYLPLDDDKVSLKRTNNLGNFGDLYGLKLLRYAVTAVDDKGQESFVTHGERNVTTPRQAGDSFNGDDNNSPIYVTWAKATDAVEYNIYKAIGSNNLRILAVVKAEDENLVKNADAYLSFSEYRNRTKQIGFFSKLQGDRNNFVSELLEDIGLDGNSVDVLISALGK